MAMGREGQIRNDGGAELLEADREREAAARATAASHGPIQNSPRRKRRQ
jgi:hypothetical protein